MEETTEVPDYLVDLYKDLPRCSPGTNDTTKKAFAMLQNLPPNPKILDVGCGTGMQTIDVAKLSHGQIIALDIVQPFLNKNWPGDHQCPRMISIRALPRVSPCSE